MSLNSFSLPIYGIFAFFIAWMLGCSRPKEPGVYVAERDLPIAEMSDGDVIFKVNGHAVRKRDFLRFQRLQARIFECLNSGRQGFTQKSVDNFVFANEQRTLPMLMQRELFTQAARSAGIDVNPSEIETAAGKVLLNCGLKSRTLADARTELGDEVGDDLAEAVKVYALSEKAIQALAGADYFTVTSEEVSNHIDRIKAFNENADRMNANARKTLLKAKSEILGGAKFADVALKYAEVCPEQSKEWQTVEMGELVAEGEDQLRKWLDKAEAGDISDPIDLDDGIAIVGVVRKGEGEVPEGMEPPVLYTLVRCTMFARQNMETLTEDEARAVILESKMEDARREVGANFYNRSVVEFPNGTNFFGRVKRP